ncbi:class I SAM-dependent methyltransferase [Aquimarina gracilis]|uniref:Class I SAM-dependent methyltransferase n=1 Tax=Aquimarina gracilis TaxID=874422 RepID=A0ABU5ZSY5_9FLAO|nr:class I SAM-dependent methyltransferase [Aquimarina gracilis]MEB3345179.1 class I SAM-dependent methyltransferase [Aquimarina gracilis]
MQEKYDVIGVNYNRTRKADPYLFERLYHLLSPSLHGTYLDIGCGTGNYTSKFAEKGFQCIGVDPSEEMLNKAKSQNKKVTWKIGKAENIDLPTESIDGVIASLTLHHWQDLTRGFSELNRVLKPNGKVIIFTATPAQMKGYWLNHYFPKMLIDSMIQMPSYEFIEACLTSNNLKIDNAENYFIQPDLQDLFLYSGKHNPKLYFDPSVRHGISSFSSLSNAEEVEKGLKKLEKDILSGESNSIIKKYENTKGDYLFMTVKKV